MDLFTQTDAYFASIPDISVWPEVQAILHKTASLQPRHWKLPGLTCEAVGGQIDQAIPATAAIACLHISIKLIDDLLDDDPKGEYHRIGKPAAANLAAIFQAAGFEAIVRSGLEPSTKLAILGSLERMVLKTALGQYLDTQPVLDEQTLWQIVQMKSAPFFGTALEIGALTGGAALDIASQVKQVGCLYGECVQIHDDLNDALAAPADPDWFGGGVSLPLLYARIVNYPERQRFLALCQEITDPEKLAEAQKILIRCGAVSFGVDRILQRHHEAMTLLKSLPLKRPEKLAELLNGLIIPIQELMRRIDPDHSVSLPSF